MAKNVRAHPFGRSLFVSKFPRQWEFDYNPTPEFKYKMQEPHRLVKPWLKPFALGGVLFLSIAQHIIHYWELPAPTMFLLFWIAVPVFTGGVFLLEKRLAPHVSQISRPQFILYLIGALLISAFITWRSFHQPASFQSLTITPHVSQTRTIVLLELKANGSVIPLREIALQNHWQEAEGALQAKQNSQPITVTFKCAANTPITLLFGNTSQNGEVEISLGRDTKQVNLNQADTGNTLVQFTARYRGIPNEVFIPFLILLDVITFGTLILLLLILQDLGQISTAQPSTGFKTATPPASDLYLLLGLGLILHLLNILSTPLILDADSPAFLQGAVYLLQHGNLDGVSKLVGPGTTFLFAPIVFLFGRNAWGMKILLHGLALACIPVGYQLGWHLSRNRWVAILSGLTIIFSPDIFFYSNYVMSDLPNILLVLLFCMVLLPALETLSLRSIITAMLVGSFATLIRSENVLLLVIGALALTATVIRDWFRDHAKDWKKHIIHIILATVIASLPILWWSEHNQRVHGFFGMSNYMGVVLYDGWVYFGDASKLSFSNPNSLAAQKIRAAVSEHPIVVTDKSGVATGWETYPALIRSGYTPEQAIGLLKDAALDSIKKNPDLTIRLLFLKLKTGLRPEITHNITYSLPGEAAWANAVKLQFFDAENVSIALLIRLQQSVNNLVDPWYPHLYPIWTVFCVLVLALSLFRRPVLVWVTLVAIIATRIFIPLTMSVPFWRYTLSGWIPLQLIVINWIWIMLSGARFLPKPNHTLQQSTQEAVS